MYDSYEELQILEIVLIN